MPINPEAVGSESEPSERAWDSKDCLLYAVGVGAGVEELPFTTENTRDVAQQVLPTMAVVLAAPRGARSRLGDYDPAMLVHGEQGVTLHQPLPVEGRARSVARISAIWDKGSGAVVVTETEAMDAYSGAPLFSLRSSVFIRGEGGWGGERGPSAPRDLIPERVPDQEVSYATSRDQALLYRLSGDRNPLHTDPSFAARGGFDRPILHGLCTYGFTGRALLHSLCGSDPARFVSMDARFSAPVFPGDELTVRMWSTGDHQAVFETRRDGGQVVIDAGRFEYR
jgi:acyl dehydratase